MEAAWINLFLSLLTATPTTSFFWGESRAPKSPCFFKDNSVTCCSIVGQIFRRNVCVTVNLNDQLKAFFTLNIDGKDYLRNELNAKEYCVPVHIMGVDMCNKFYSLKIRQKEQEIEFCLKFSVKATFTSRTVDLKCHILKYKNKIRPTPKPATGKIDTEPKTDKKRLREYIHIDTANETVKIPSEITTVTADITKPSVSSTQEGERIATTKSGTTAPNSASIDNLQSDVQKETITTDTVSNIAQIIYSTTPKVEERSEYTTSNAPSASQTQQGSTRNSEGSTVAEENMEMNMRSVGNNNGATIVSSTNINDFTTLTTEMKTQRDENTINYVSSTFSTLPDSTLTDGNIKKDIGDVNVKRTEPHPTDTTKETRNLPSETTTVSVDTTKPSYGTTDKKEQVTTTEGGRTDPTYNEAIKKSQSEVPKEAMTSDKAADTAQIIYSTTPRNMEKYNYSSLNEPSTKQTYQSSTASPDIRTTGEINSEITTQSLEYTSEPGYISTNIDDYTTPIPEKETWNPGNTNKDVSTTISTDEKSEKSIAGENVNRTETQPMDIAKETVKLPSEITTVSVDITKPSVTNTDLNEQISTNYE